MNWLKMLHVCFYFVNILHATIYPDLGYVRLLYSISNFTEHVLKNGVISVLFALLNCLMAK